MDSTHNLTLPEWGWTNGLAYADLGVLIPFNQWMLMEVEVKLNTPGLTDGELRMWLNGTSVPSLTRTGLDIRGARIPCALDTRRQLSASWHAQSRQRRL